MYEDGAVPPVDQQAYNELRASPGYESGISGFLSFDDKGAPIPSSAFKFPDHLNRNFV